MPNREYKQVTHKNNEQMKLHENYNIVIIFKKKELVPLII